MIFFSMSFSFIYHQEILNNLQLKRGNQFQIILIGNRTMRKLNDRKEI